MSLGSERATWVSRKRPHISLEVSESPVEASESHTQRKRMELLVPQIEGNTAPLRPLQEVEWQATERALACRMDKAPAEHVLEAILMRVAPQLNTFASIEMVIRKLVTLS